MNVELNPNERELLAAELERSVIPEIRGEIASGMPKTLREELKKDEATFKEILNKLKQAV